MPTNLFINDLKADNHKVLEATFNKYYKVLVLFSFSYVKDKATAEDLVQDVFVMIYEKRETLTIHTSIKAFLYASVRNQSLNYLKKTNVIVYNQQLIDSNESEFSVESSATVNLAELSEKLYNAIEKLPNQNQEIFKMSRLDGHSNQEIADELGLTKRTVETHISNALKKLRVLVKSTPIIFLLFFLRVFNFWLS